MNTNRQRAVTAVYIILRRGDTILFGRRCNTGYEDGNYQMPAGHVDPGEFPIAAIIREAREEVGVILQPEQVRFVHAGFRRKVQEGEDRVDYYFEATEWDGEPKNMEPDKCDDLTWVDSNALPTNTVFHIQKALDAIQRGELYSEIEV